MGADQIDFSVERTIEQRSIPFVLPKQSRQGQLWYLIRLHFTIVFSERSSSGFVFVSGLTNARAAAQVEFQVRRSARGARVIRWRTLDYIRGGRSRVTTNRRIEIWFENYLQYRGVHGGRNALTVQLERFKGVDIDSLTVHPDSGIEVSPIGPAQLRLAVEPDSQHVSKGDEFVVRYRLKNVGDRPALHVTVASEHGNQVEDRGAREHSRAVLRDSLSGSFRFRAVEAGDFPVGIVVDSGTNHPAALVEVHVTRSRSLAEVLARVAPSLAGLLLVIAGIRIIRPVLQRRGQKSHS